MGKAEELYDLSELLPLVAELTDKYTSKESSSVSYETARMLLEAILYTMNERITESAKNASNTAAKEDDGELLVESGLPSPECIYQEGIEIIRKKAKKAVQCYEKLMAGFEDYGCENYHDTIVKGMPEFFLRYDVMFKPQDHLLTLDYPQMHPDMSRSGIDLILEYLLNIRLEKQFLDAFSGTAVRNLLERLHPSYEKLYLDNICEPVLFTAMLCGVAGTSVRELKLDQKAFDLGISYFRADTLEEIEAKVEKLIRQMTDRIPDAGNYFTLAARDFAVRIQLFQK